MKQKKGLFLFLALILPVCIFVFLKLFGRNEFAVKPLYSDTYPTAKLGCAEVTALPYYIPDSVKSQVPIKNDSLIILTFGALENESQNQMNRVREEIATDPVSITSLSASGKTEAWKRCVFFMDPPLDIAVVDQKGAIRGTYASADREDMDRLLTELTIMLKKY